MREKLHITGLSGSTKAQQRRVIQRSSTQAVLARSRISYNHPYHIPSWASPHKPSAVPQTLVSQRGAVTRGGAVTLIELCCDLRGAVTLIGDCAVT